MAYLDETGLAYYDGKLKNWIEGSSSDIAHKTGDEIIGGVKTFQNTAPGKVEGETVTDLIIRNPEVTRGVPLEDGRTYTRVILADAEGETEETFAGRLGLLEVQSPKAEDAEGANLNLRCYKYDTDPDHIGWAVSLTVGYDVNGTPYASAPPTSALRSDDKDILTRDWIPKDTRIVHTTRNETIGGNKVFSGAIKLGSSSSSGIICSADTANSAMEVDVYGASEYNNGAVLRVFGKSNQYNPGYFICRAATSSSVAKQFAGRPDGTLTWDGQPIQTSSDERLKTPLAAVPDAVLDAWGDVNWGQFQYLEAVAEKSERARLHLGLIAQRVKAAFEARGLDACAYGILCHEEHPAVDEEETVVDAEAYTDEEGVEHPAVSHVEVRHEEAVDLWMVRYTEAQAMEAAFQRRRADRLEARIAALEAKLA